MRTSTCTINGDIHVYMSLIIGFTCNSYENAYFVIFFYTKLPGQQRLKKTTFHSDTKDSKKNQLYVKTRSKNSSL